mgnify:CR=1 FL=1
MIYFLEDDDSIRKLVIYGLESQGFEAEGFSLPSKFWRAMEQHPAELVLLDIMLPEEDGLQILKKLRAAPETRRLPVILLTAKNSEFDRVIGLDRLKAIHLNDSLNPFGAHKDRHARIGEGQISKAALIRVVCHPLLKHLPFYLETPNELDGYAAEIQLMRQASVAMGE